MSILHIPSKDRDEIRRIIDSAKERGSIILYYDALRILKIAGASVVTTHLALNSQELMIFASQIEPPIILKKVIYDRLPESGVEIHKGIKDSIEAINLAHGSCEFIEGMSFLVQETAPGDLRLSICVDNKNLKLVDKKTGVSVLMSFLRSVDDLILEKDTLKTFLFNSTESPDYDIKSLGMLLLILCSVMESFSSIERIEIRSMFLYREGLGYIITDAFMFLK